MNPALAHPYVVARCKCHALDSTGKRSGIHEKLDVGRPSLARDEGLIAKRLDEVAKQRNAVQTESVEGISHALNVDKEFQRPRSEREQSSNARRSFAHLALGHHDVRTSLESLDELGQVLGLVGEIALHQDHRIASRIPCSPGYLATQAVEGVGVALPLLAMQNRQWGNFCVRQQPVAGLVGASIVVNDDLILARVCLEDLADTPQQDTYGGPFVVCRDADVEQCASMTWLIDASPQDRRALTVPATEN